MFNKPRDASQPRTPPATTRQPHPGTITDVVEQERARKHLGRRVNVFVEGKFSFALDASLAARRGLEIDRYLSAQELSDLLREDGDARALAKALYFLSFRPRSEKEVRERLTRDEWPLEVIDRVIEQLRAGGALNDAQFAADYVTGRSLSKPRGGRMLKMELSRKGVGKEEIEAALPDTDEEVQNAVFALQKVARRFERLEEGRERDQKRIEFLQRRGFGWSTARAAVHLHDEEDD